MYDSPLSLREYCLDFVRESFSAAICESDGNCRENNTNCHNKARFASMLGDCGTLTSNITEKLLTSFSEKNQLNDSLMQNVFDADHTRLEVVQIPNASELTTKGLRILRGHKIKELEVIGLSKITINELIGCLGEWSLNNLRYMNVSRSSFTSSTKFCIVVGLAKLRNLHTLNVSHTEFNHHGLEIVVEDLPLLENLNISATRVRDISPLKKCKGRLKSLFMYNVRSLKGGCEDFSPVLLELNKLSHLDMSDEGDNPMDLMLSKANDCTTDVLKRPDLFPNLVYLDISGKETVDIELLRKFVAYRRQNACALKFLGLMQTGGLCFDDIFVNESHKNYDKDLIVTGHAAESQILESLKRYINRPLFIQKALFHLYGYTSSYDDPRVDIIELIIPVMKRHEKLLAVQMASTACLYNLTKGKFGEKIHPGILSKVVGVTIVAMENFPNQQQIQKNTLLSLCSDRILQDVTFNRYKCTKLVMDSLVSFSDSSMNRMSVAICSILAAKISTIETSYLGAKPIYMETLLGILNSRLAQHSVASSQNQETDLMLKFTLSALWNLTDESPTTCSMFLIKGGMNIYLRILQKFSGKKGVETKVLGLINNIAEVGRLRKDLMKDEFIVVLRSLLLSNQIDVSYFAAGIFAHLASDGHEKWICDEIKRDDIVKDLNDTVLGWKIPEMEMVAYRSFTPFVPLLGCIDSNGVQMWAVWAIHHVCSKNPQRYCQMLIEDNILAELYSIIDRSSKSTDEQLVKICIETINVIASEYPYVVRNRRLVDKFQI